MINLNLAQARCCSWYLF